MTGVEADTWCVTGVDERIEEPGEDIEVAGQRETATGGVLDE